jgi:hypothetical protein
MCDLAERHVEQARVACRHFMDAASKTHDTIGALVPETSLTAGMKQVRQRTMKLAAQNMDAGFSLAGELAKAKNFPEMLEVQSRNAELQMTKYSRQAQELVHYCHVRDHSGPWWLRLKNRLLCCGAVSARHLP